jgi:hypothetical protein
MVEIWICAATTAQGCVEQNAEMRPPSSPQVARVKEITYTLSGFAPLFSTCAIRGSTVALFPVPGHAGAAAALLDQERYSAAAGKQLLHIRDQSGRSTTQHVSNARG